MGRHIYKQMPFTIDRYHNEIQCRWNRDIWRGGRQVREGWSRGNTCDESWKMSRNPPNEQKEKVQTDRKPGIGSLGTLQLFPWRTNTWSLRGMWRPLNGEHGLLCTHRVGILLRNNMRNLKKWKYLSLTPYTLEKVGHILSLLSGLDYITQNSLS